MLLLVGITGCATFNNKYVSSRTLLEPDNIKFHNGIFDMTTDSGYNKRGELEAIRNQHGNLSLYSVIANKILKRDSMATYSAKVTFQTNQIQFDFYKGTNCFESVTMKARLRSNGMYYMNNS